ncbi:MAG: hypothetical protein IPH16_14375 [Haliscomenobacter sp.]|nr:hypothetical protein [Haliscomenobacter sp.]
MHQRLKVLFTSTAKLLTQLLNDKADGTYLKNSTKSPATTSLFWTTSDYTHSRKRTNSSFMI